MNVVAVSRAYRPDAFVDQVFGREDATSALGQADFIVIAMPSNDEKRGFFDRSAFAAMKRSAILINVAHGDLIVEFDLVAACREGLIAGAGLYVTAECRVALRTDP